MKHVEACFRRVTCELGPHVRRGSRRGEGGRERKRKRERERERGKRNGEEGKGERGESCSLESLAKVR